MAQASYQDRVEAATIAIGRQRLQTGLMIGDMAIPRNVARKLAELAVDAVIAADNTESEQQAEVLRADQERRLRETHGNLSPSDLMGG